MNRETWKSIEITVEIIHQTDMAFLVDHEGVRDTAVWVPKSQIRYYDDSWNNGDIVDIEIPEWLAYEKDII